jgi:hypothetical protein
LFKNIGAMNMRKQSWISILVLNFFLLTTLRAECPCDSFVADIQNLKSTDLYGKPGLKMIRISDCVKCRENLGLHYHFCGSWLHGNIEDSQLSRISNDSITRDLMSIINRYKDNCEEQTLYDIDYHINGSHFIAGGLSLISVGVVLNIFTPKILTWGFNKNLFESEALTFEPLVYLIKAIVAIVVGFIGVLADVGGVTMITIGSLKIQTYNTFQTELPRFKDDLNRLGITVELSRPEKVREIDQFHMYEYEYDY